MQADSNVRPQIPMPVQTKRTRSRVGDREAVLSTAGSWKGLADADVLKAQRASGRESNRSPIDL